MSSHIRQSSSGSHIPLPAQHPAATPSVDFPSISPSGSTSSSHPRPSTPSSIPSYARATRASLPSSPAPPPRIQPSATTSARSPYARPPPAHPTSSSAEKAPKRQPPAITGAASRPSSSSLSPSTPARGKSSSKTKTAGAGAQRGLGAGVSNAAKKKLSKSLSPRSSKLSALAPSFDFHPAGFVLPGSVEKENEGPAEGDLCRPSSAAEEPLADEEEPTGTSENGEVGLEATAPEDSEVSVLDETMASLPPLPLEPDSTTLQTTSSAAGGPSSSPEAASGLDIPSIPETAVEGERALTPSFKEMEIEAEDELEEGEIREEREPRPLTSAPSTDSLRGELVEEPAEPSHDGDKEVAKVPEEVVEERGTALEAALIAEEKMEPEYVVEKPLVEDIAVLDPEPVDEEQEVEKSSLRSAEEDLTATIESPLVTPRPVSQDEELVVAEPSYEDPSPPQDAVGTAQVAAEVGATAQKIDDEDVEVANVAVEVADSAASLADVVAEPARAEVSPDPVPTTVEDVLVLLNSEGPVDPVEQAREFELGVDAPAPIALTEDDMPTSAEEVAEMPTLDDILDVDELPVPSGGISALEPPPQDSLVSPPVPLSLALVSAWSSTTWAQRVPALCASVTINFGLPFVNGVMLGFGELFARNYIGVRLFGWGTPFTGASSGLGGGGGGRANTASLGLRAGERGSAATRTARDVVVREGEVLAGGGGKAGI